MSKKDPKEDPLTLGFTSLLSEVGERPERDGLLSTPKRAAETLRYLTSGYKIDLSSLMKDALFDSPISEMVIIKDLELYSLCEHHLLPFFGKCHIGYLPNGKIIGLSKVATLVDAFARRLQTQESLSQQIALSIEEFTRSKGVGVVIEATHLCMRMRGPEKQFSQLVTSVMLGHFRHNSPTRMEFLSLIRKSGFTHQ